MSAGEVYNILTLSRIAECYAMVKLFTHCLKLHNLYEQVPCEIITLTLIYLFIFKENVRCFTLPFQCGLKSSGNMLLSKC